MSRLTRFSVKITTGNNSMTDPVFFIFNSHELAFENCQGTTATGQQFSGDFSPMSFVHQLTLRGPTQGQWDIEGMETVFECEGQDPYTINFGAFTLDENNQANLWSERPQPTFNV